MNKKVVIVGGVAGGASTAARLRRLDENIEIVMLEKGEHISFANCGLPYHIGGVIKNREDLLVQTPEAMKNRFKIDVRIKNEVIDIDRKNKKITVMDLNNDEKYEESYDILVLSPGAEPTKPPVKGINGERVFTLRNIPDTDRINKFIANKKPRRAVVIGAGYIGIEMAENLTHRGINVSVVEMENQILTSLDKEMLAQAHNHLRMKGVNLFLGSRVEAIDDVAGKKVVELSNCDNISADFIVLAAGVTPNTKLAEDAGLEIGKLGGIKVDEYLKTSDVSIFALGDAIEVKNPILEKETYIPLAGPANKQGRIVANNIAGRNEKFNGSQGTAIAKVFELTVGSTGLNEKQLQDYGIDYEKSYTISKNHAGYYPGAIPMTIKLLFSKDDGKLYGAQAVGYKDVDKRLDVLATAIRFEKKVHDLKDIDLAYAPPFGSAKDPVNMAGFISENILTDTMDTICCDELDEKENIQLIDVREPEELRELGTIKNAIHIPLNSLRDNLDELDKNKETVVFCAIGLRGYLGYRILKQHGFDNLLNLSGGYKMYLEYQKDKYEVVDEDATKARAKMETIETPEEAHRL
ncbi:MAG: CoA-disulfide reductase [Candidatus Mcinerneyibacterium aminivorans]|uniref:CoA-disulfide reductase n=1 Tax=Candidatus Mcinerneyibacterium aminivorans TaxID=2703815 RepID=A0A5D0MFE9_9BACT|nr:MAG: CoA-disulfide reductase [Candidatus Mcinerneyibacterium aminivorans]